jgi:hypothetical protein
VVNKQMFFLYLPIVHPPFFDSPCPPSWCTPEDHLTCQESDAGATN